MLFLAVWLFGDISNLSGKAYDSPLRTLGVPQHVLCDLRLIVVSQHQVPS